MRRLLMVISALLVFGSTGVARGGDCARPLTKGSEVPKASDALFILQSAIGARDCRLEDCDVNEDCEVQASDALGTLDKVVRGVPTPRTSESECPTITPCEESDAPACNGVCPEGEACAVRESEGEQRVTICHVPPGNPANAHTIVVGAPATRAHVAHGDTLGPCPDDEPDDGNGEPGCETGDDCGDGSGGTVVTTTTTTTAEIDCACVPIIPASTTTLAGPTTTTLVGPTTTTLAGPSTTTLGPPTTTTLPAPIGG